MYFQIVPNTLNTCEIFVSEVSLISYLSDCESSLSCKYVCNRERGSQFKIKSPIFQKNKYSYLQKERTLRMHGRRGEVYKFLKKSFVAHEALDLNIPWHSNSFGKYFMAPPINFSFLFKAYLWQYFRVVLTVIFKFQITKEIKIHNNIQKIIFK